MEVRTFQYNHRWMRSGNHPIMTGIMEFEMDPGQVATVDATMI
jgi:hypothetical protein